MHKVTSDIWLSRCQAQVSAVLDVLERIRAEAKSEWLMGEAMQHPDIALGCAVRHARDAHGDAIDWAPYPALLAHSAKCEALAVFQAIQQAFTGPSDS